MGDQKQQQVKTARQSVTPSLTQRDLGKPPGLENYTACDAFTPKNFDLQVAQDIKHVAILQAAKIIASIQHWQRELAPDDDVNFVFATGKSQLMAIAEVARIKENWNALEESEKRLLEGLGVDFNNHLDAPFDPSRIKAFHLDTIFPQSRDALMSYAVQVSAFCDKLGIQKDKRLLWYGDVKAPSEECLGEELLDPSKNRLTEEEYKAVTTSIKAEGLLVESYKAGTLDKSHIQYIYLNDMERYRDAYANKLQSLGGGHILMFGVGSGYRGDGHVGFVEAADLSAAAEDFLKLPAFMGLASYSALAGNIKDTGGMHHAFASNGEQTVGATTLASKDFRHNPNATIILTIAGQGKQSSVLSCCEGPQSPEFPTTVLHGIGKTDSPQARSTVIVGPSCFQETLYGMLPELFDATITDLSDKTNFLTRATLAYNQRNADATKTIDSITYADIIALVHKDPDSDKARELTERLKGILDEPRLRAAKENLLTRITKAYTSVDTFWDRLCVSVGDTILNISPHLDDVTLALGPDVIRTAIKKNGARHKVVTATPGDSAVATEYVINVLYEIERLQQRDIEDAVSAASTKSGAALYEKTQLESLTRLLEDTDQKAPVNNDHHDYNFWNKLPKAEKRLRAKLALLSLVRSWQSAEKDASSLPPTSNLRAHVEALRRILTIHSQESPEWTSPPQPKILRYIKEWIRVVEDQTAFMASGVAYDDYSPPDHPSWYTGGASREKTLSEVDINDMKEHILQTRPKVIVLNGEGFMDHEAHCLTEMATRIALEQLINDGSLDWECRVLLYRGVWDRTAVSGSPSQLLLKIDDTELQRLDHLFRAHYRSQVPALVPDGGCPNTFFSQRVIQNATATARSLRGLLGEARYNETFGERGGVLAFDTVDLTDEQHRKEFARVTKELEDELNRVRDSIERGAQSKVVGKAPYVDLEVRKEEVYRLLDNRGVKALTLFREEELNGFGILDAQRSVAS